MAKKKKPMAKPKVATPAPEKPSVGLQALKDTETQAKRTGREVQQGVEDTAAAVQKGAQGTVGAVEQGLNKIGQVGQSLWDTVASDPLAAAGALGKAILPGGLAPVVDGAVGIAKGGDVKATAMKMGEDYLTQAVGEKQMERLRAIAEDPQGAIEQEVATAAQPLMQQAAKQMEGAQAKVQEMAGAAQQKVGEVAGTVQQKVGEAAGAVTQPMTQAQQQVQANMPGVDTQGASTTQAASASVGRRKKMFKLGGQ